nr:iron chelate uptake ABC transporter family permease subunit [Kibdelosporangium sp. MJ126-NF4]CEL21562.1 ABC-type Fe3+-siderophore transport system, permease 2 component [Kibdelosporangium sp. MJ126-NF4]CTQ95870.1 ABC-type Fe3+-siderophore transport system, permease 2 component [Kibdelosporangium sp. MJ126-NF4]
MRAQWIVRTAGHRVALRLRQRAVMVFAGLFLLCLAVLAVSLFVGDFPIPFGHVIDALAGQGTRAQRYFVNDVRLPRALVALLAGAALAVSGAIFQSLSRNPLGSPDVLGFNSGAAVGALICILVFRNASQIIIGVGAVGGATAVVLLTYLLAYRGGVQGFRLVLVGVGMSSLLGSAVAYLLSRADLTDSLNAQVWLVGSLNGRGWDQVVVLLVVLAVGLPAAGVLSSQLLTMELGPDVAGGLGLDSARVRRRATAVSVLLTAGAITAAGPIAFVALCAPQIAKRVARSAGPSVAVSALVGAVLLAVADLIAQEAIPGVELPVGVTTLVLGGLCLGWLLVGETRRGNV